MYSLTDLGRTLVEPIDVLTNWVLTNWVLTNWVLTNWARDNGGAIVDFQEQARADIAPPL